MKIILIGIVAVLPCIACLVIVYFFLKKNTESKVAEMSVQLKLERQKFFLPNRVDAYQRAVLLMERISPNNLVMRLHNPGLPAKALQAEFLKAIREEYDHNVAQQLFISTQGWDLIKNSKEETIKIINIAGGQMEATSTGMDLSGKIFEVVAEVGELPTEIASKYLKEELQRLF